MILTSYVFRNYEVMVFHSYVLNSTHLQWYKDDSFLVSSTEYMITSASSADGGLYQCRATNSRGESTREHTVLVNGKERFDDIR